MAASKSVIQSSDKDIDDALAFFEPANTIAAYHLRSTLSKDKELDIGRKTKPKPTLDQLDRMLR